MAAIDSSGYRPRPPRCASKLSLGKLSEVDFAESFITEQDANGNNVPQKAILRRLLFIIKIFKQNSGVVIYCPFE
ncbi:hypothetical protein SPHINGO8BC_70067 [Sphingobacterium multivorum]|uniref:Uncharacterized protein n=1 Tax=Sphingobacterium multivorum TaxID=28454 RepID=A0A654DMI2_SPHMU|nr:hypothetical protein SPHINGO8BC_70067 [Sphingobacterium multivorum]